MSLQFQYPEYTWVFALLLIPIIIHLLRLRRRQVVYFPGLFRLKQLVKETQSQQRLKHWLLLLNRTLLFFFLALILTKPSCKQEISNTNTATYGVILDLSSSMWEKDEQGNIPIDKLKNGLIQWLDKLSPETPLYVLDRPNQSTTEYTASDLKSYILQISKPLGSYPLKDLWFQNTKPQGVQNWYVFSDLDSDIKFDLGSLQDSINRFTAIDLGIQRGVNYSIDTAFVEDLNTGSVVWQVSRNDIEKEALLMLDIFVDDKLVSKETVVFDANESSVRGKIEQTELIGKAIKLQIPDDALSADNTLFTHPNRDPKYRIWTHNALRFASFNTLFKTFSDRFELVDSMNQADVFLWISSEKNNADWNQTLEYVSKGKVVVVIPENANSSIPFDLINGGSWERLEQSKADCRIDERRFKQWPFDQILERDLENTTITPRILNSYKVPYEKNADWQRYLTTQGDHDLVLLKSIEEGKLWLFTSDITNGLKELESTTWFVGVMVPLLLSGNMESQPIANFMNAEWWTLPFSDKFVSGEKITMEQSGQKWTSVIGLNEGSLSLQRIEDWGLKSGFLKVKSESTDAQVFMSINAPRCEQRINQASTERNIKLNQPKLEEWLSSNQKIGANSSNWAGLKWVILVLLITEVLIQNLVLRTNR